MSMYKRIHVFCWEMDNKKGLDPESNPRMLILSRNSIAQNGSQSTKKPSMGRIPGLYGTSQ